MKSFKALVVDDFEPFRRWVCSTLQQRPHFQVLEASDGLEAVHRAQDAKPHLILLDIVLPRLNGIEAARCLRELGCPARILFVSQEFSPEVVQETLAVGALGFVHKLRAPTELLSAIDAVLEGKCFISSGLLTHKPGKAVSKSQPKECEVPTSKRPRSRERARQADAPQYPWQHRVMDAFQSPLHALPGKINVAERALAERLADLERATMEERLAVKEAVSSLRVLNAQTRPKPEASETKEIA